MPFRTTYPVQRAAVMVVGMTVTSFLGVLMTQQSVSAQQDSKSWTERSNENAQIVLEVLARFSPETAAQFGVTGMDEEIFDLNPQIYERTQEATQKVVAELRRRLQEEKDKHVRQDLEILIEQAELQMEGARLERETFIPYFNLSRTIYFGFQSLLDDQIPAERRAAALVRLKRYAGMEEGYTPIAQLAQDRIEERMEVEGLLSPSKAELEKDLGTSTQIVTGIGALFEKYELSGYEEAFAALQEQLAGYDEFVRNNILPDAREDFRQPPQIYAHNLRNFGVDFGVEELTGRAKTSFREIQNEMQALAPMVAREYGFVVTDYRDVIRELKKNQLVGEEILPHYQKRIGEIEKIIEREEIITLPDREMQIRLASEAESAALPAPHMSPPRMIGNTGEKGTFVLPLKIPSADGEESVGFDDFTFDASSWTLTAHEGRPGHELQFAAMIENGVSIVRAIFAFNSVNVEGWALYTEAEMKPYLPVDGQLIALQHRLMRAARAFLDPGLQLGHITREEAMRVMTEEVVVSEAMALQEVERYTFRMPGQATSYFCGYEHLMALRTDVEMMLGANFNRSEYHDFILSQGLLPPDLLREAVMKDFVPRYKKAS